MQRYCLTGFYISFIFIFSGCHPGKIVPPVPSLDLLGKVSNLKYYSAEVIPLDFLAIYGNWKSIITTSGLDGSTSAPKFDYIEIKGFGIYGIVKEFVLVEYGKIEVVSIDGPNNRLIIKLIPDFRLNASNIYTSTSNQFISIGNNILSIGDTVANGLTTSFSKVF